HGEQCGVGTIMMMYLHAGNWQEVRDALLVIGAPTTARALGVTDDEVVQALVHAHDVNKERYTILGAEGLTLEAAERLAKITKVGWRVHGAVLQGPEPGGTYDED